MSETTVEALKALAAAYKGNDAKAEDISGTTIPEVLDALTAIVTEKAAMQSGK